MSETQRTDLADAARAELDPLADLVQSTFSELSRALVDDLAQASLEGRGAIADLADGIIEELARVGAERFIEQPLRDVFSSASNPFISTLLKRDLRNG